jgi:raffinose/stachyose/melibiose transport system permease protein
MATQIYKETYAFGNFGYGAALSLILTVFVTAVALVQLAALRKREEAMS